MNAVLRELRWPVLILVVIFGVIFATRSCGPKIGFLDLKVVNNTDRTVTVAPCWDVYCIDRHGLAPSVLSPGHSTHEAGDFPTDVGGFVVLGIRKPGGKPWEFKSCLMTGYQPGQTTGVVRVSQARRCFPAPGSR